MIGPELGPVVIALNRIADVLERIEGTLLAVLLQTPEALNVEESDDDAG